MIFSLTREFANDYHKDSAKIMRIGNRLPAPHAYDALKHQTKGRGSCAFITTAIATST